MENTRRFVLVKYLPIRFFSHGNEYALYLNLLMALYARC